LVQALDDADDQGNNVIDALDQPSILIPLGALFLIGLAADLLGRFTFLPRVTLLLLGGLALGPAGFFLLPRNFIEGWFPALTSIALALIGFLLGQQLSISALRKHGRTVVGIALSKLIGAWLAVGLGLMAAGVSPAIALLLGGIAPATAPTATYDIVHESGATGEFAETLLSIVALDDVLGLLLFIVMMACVGTLNGDVGVIGGVATSLSEIGGSVALGLALGVPMAYLTGRIQPGEPSLAEAMGFVLLGAGISAWLDLSPILTTMVMGSVVASLATHHDRPFHAIEGVEWPFMILFFVLAGASLEVDSLRLVGGLTALYIVLRCAGTYVGTRTGARFTDAGPELRKWLGLALFPQAGVALGMALAASQRFPEVVPIVLPVILASTIILEIVSPLITRQALRASGAIESNAS
jgi:Kef-type K+ transport system membrane component KefB